MSAVLLAIFNEYKVAERARVELVRAGFPTDRVELTAACEPGRAGLGPADSPHGRFVQYYRVLFTFEDERHQAEQLAERVDNGAATVTVHPRGPTETARAMQILGNAGAAQLVSHDLFPHTRYSPPRYITAVIAGYFDLQLGPGELHPERPSNRDSKLEFISNTTVGVLDAGIHNSDPYPNRRSDEH